MEKEGGITDRAAAGTQMRLKGAWNADFCIFIKYSLKFIEILEKDFGAQR
jgi:hypothetical protein